jgi:hypothetical protein
MYIYNYFLFLGGDDLLEKCLMQSVFADGIFEVAFLNLTSNPSLPFAILAFSDIKFDENFAVSKVVQSNVCHLEIYRQLSSAINSRYICSCNLQTRLANAGAFMGGLGTFADNKCPHCKLGSEVMDVITGKLASALFNGDSIIPLQPLMEDVTLTDWEKLVLSKVLTYVKVKQDIMPQTYSSMHCQSINLVQLVFHNCGKWVFSFCQITNLNVSIPPVSVVISTRGKGAKGALIHCNSATCKLYNKAIISDSSSLQSGGEGMCIHCAAVVKDKIFKEEILIEVTTELQEQRAQDGQEKVSNLLIFNTVTKLWELPNASPDASRWQVQFEYVLFFDLLQFLFFIFS